jgi:hypothetical protein
LHAKSGGNVLLLPALFGKFQGTKAAAFLPVRGELGLSDMPGMYHDHRPKFNNFWPGQ